MNDQIGHARQVLGKASRRRWLERRRKGITATDVAAILGHNPYKTPVDVWLSKREPADPGNTAGYAAQRGLLLEGLLLNTWADETGAQLLTVPKLVSHPQQRWALASLDGAAHLDGETVIVEAKTAGWRAREDWWDETKLIPDAYAIQVLWQLYVTGLDTAHVVADIAGDRRTLTISRDHQWEAAAVPLIHDWWQHHVVADVAPDPDPVRDFPALNRLWVPEPGSELVADPDLHQLALTWFAATERAKARTAVANELRGQVRIAMTTHETLLTPDGETSLATNRADKNGRRTLRLTYKPQRTNLEGKPQK